MTAVIVPFRDRGRDPLRQANLERVLSWWTEEGLSPVVVDDGRSGDEQFNRSRAYNNGIAVVSAEVYVFTESDMLISRHQVDKAIALATEAPGVVVPFRQYRALEEISSALVRNYIRYPYDCTPDFVMDDDSIGAINVVSHATLEATGGWDENFCGSWWDDRAMFRAFEVCAGPPRWVDGPAWHLWHLPGASGEHLTDEDRAATARNEERWRRYEQAQTPEEIRALIKEGR